MTEDQKQALIEDCKASIARIEKTLPHWQKSTYTLPYLESELARQKIALAALTAEPVRYLNKFSGVCVSIEQQPNASEDEAVYLPLFIHPAPAVDLVYQVPDGWKLVPVEITQEMVDANFEGVCIGGIQAGYRAMLAAAPEVE